MSAGSIVMGRGARLKMLAAAAAVVAVLTVLAPRPAHGAATWKECIDKAFGEYNSCLMESESRFNRFLCDVDFELKSAKCTAAHLGDIKNAWNEGSGGAS